MTRNPNVTHMSEVFIVKLMLAIPNICTDYEMKDMIKKSHKRRHITSSYTFPFSDKICLTSNIIKGKKNICKTRMKKKKRKKKKKKKKKKKM
jgi:hypothetical protein